MFSDSDRRGREDERRGLFYRDTRGAVCGEASRSVGNERGQLAGSVEVNS